MRPAGNHTLAAVICASIVAMMLSVPAFCATPKFPALTGRVVDDANILSPATRDELTAMLARHEQATGQQVVVVTLASLQGDPIEEFGYQLGRYWGIGQKGKNTGALLIVAPHERKVRIEVGYGLEGTLTDARSRIIIEREILPAFKEGNYDAGVLNGTSGILAVLGGVPVENESPETSPAQSLPDSVWAIPLLFGGWFLFVFIRTRLMSPSERRARRRALRRRMASPVFIPAPFPSGRKYRGGFRGGPFGGGFYGGGGGGGGFGGGGFSGGGGSFGGGGASGSW